MTDELTGAGASRCALARRDLLMSSPDSSLIAFDPFVNQAAKIVVGDQERQARRRYA
jgi:hypothetical protein